MVAKVRERFAINKQTAQNLVAQLVGALRYKLERRGFDSRLGRWGFFIDLIFPHCGHVIDSEISLGVKGGRCVVLRTLPLSCAVCLEIMGI